MRRLGLAVVGLVLGYLFAALVFSGPRESGWCDVAGVKLDAQRCLEIRAAIEDENRP